MHCMEATGAGKKKNETSYLASMVMRWVFCAERMLTLSDTCFAKWRQGFVFLRHALNSFTVTLLSFLIMTTCFLLQLKSSCLSVVWFTINHQERILKIPDEDQKKFNEKYLNKMKECEVASRMDFFILFWVL